MRYGRKILAATMTVLAATALFSGCKDNPEPEPETCAHAHVISSVVAEPDCENDGTVKYECADCGEILRYENSAALGHDYTHAEQTGQCARCGAEICTPGLYYELSSDGGYYTVSDKNFVQNVTRIIIPEYRDGLPVREIASEGFTGRYWINEITIPRTITKIGDGAFSGCRTLKVNFNAENCADFNGRNWVFYPDSTYGTNIELVVGKRVKRIPARMFYPLATDPAALPTVSGVTFAEGSELQSIGDYAFYRSDLAALSLPDGVTEIGDYAFSDSENLGGVVFGAGLKTIGVSAFEYCIRLQSVDLSGSDLTGLGARAFGNCLGLLSVNLPQSLSVIGDKAFIGCAKLEEAAFPSVTQIGEYAFSDCSAITTVTLPENLVSLGEGAFKNCASLSSLYFEAAAMGDLAGGNAVFLNSGVAQGVIVTVGNGVTAIPSRLFYSSSDVQSNMRISELRISASVKSIGDYAFLGVEIEQSLYAGTAAQWAEIAIGAGNDSLGATVYGG